VTGDTEAAGRKPAGRRGWEILGIVGGALFVCLAVIFIWVSVVAGRKYGELDARCRVSIEGARARDPLRPVLLGTAEPGNACEDYALAFKELKKTKDFAKLALIVERHPKADLEFGKSALAEQGRALELLSRGARRSGSKWEYRWEDGSGMELPGLLASHHLASLGVLRGRSLAEGGKPREAAGILLDIAQMGRDIGSDGPMICEMIGIALLDQSFREIRDLLVAGSFDTDSLADLDAGLAVLDDNYMSHARILANEAMLMSVSMRDEGGRARWVFGKMLCVDGAERMDRALDRMAKAESLPWAEARKEMDAVVEEGRSSWNPVARIALPGLGGSSDVVRERQAQLRLLRTAVRFKRTGEILELDDPLGSKLHVSRTGGALKVWSSGRDGVDDGGTGGWQAKSKDIVLELPPK